MIFTDQLLAIVVFLLFYRTSAEFNTFKRIEATNETVIPLLAYSIGGPNDTGSLCAGICNANSTCQLFLLHGGICYLGNEETNGTLGQGILDSPVLVHVDTGLVQKDHFWGYKQIHFLMHFFSKHSHTAGEVHTDQGRYRDCQMVTKYIPL